MAGSHQGTLHVTNGDIVANRIRESGVGGEVLPWRDVLHEGPVPTGLPEEELREVRARYIAGEGWGTQEEVLRSFTERDALLARHGEFDETVLWFEHDLYDQLQLVQLLDWFARHDEDAGTVSLICIGSFPGFERFDGLGQLDPGQLASLFPGRHTVTLPELALARDAWAALGSAHPTSIEQVLAGDTSALPFLAGALRRYLEQYPAVGDGLSRTERQVLEAVAAAEDGATPEEVFCADQAREERVFMGDSTLWGYVRDLAVGPEPLLCVSGGREFRLPVRGESRDQGFREQRLELTPAGEAVLRGEADRVALNGIDRWLGGVHLQGRAVRWRWDRDAGRIVKVKLG